MATKQKRNTANVSKAAKTSRATSDRKKQSNSSRTLAELARESTIIKWLLTAMFVVFLVSLGAWFGAAVSKHNNNVRLERINEIVGSIQLDKEYTPSYRDVFGDKRTYEHDSSRSYSSQVIYQRNAPVDQTTEEVKKAILAAGFTAAGDAYIGSTSPQYYFKNDKGEYVRLQVSSKSRDDAFMNKTVPQEEAMKIDPNSAPSNVSIKVNLDDNNE